MLDEVQLRLVYQPYEYSSYNNFPSSSVFSECSISSVAELWPYSQPLRSIEWRLQRFHGRSYAHVLGSAVFSAKANDEEESINMFSCLILITLSSLYDQAASSNQIQSEIHIGSDMDSSRRTSTTHSHVLGYDDVGGGGGAWSTSLFCRKPTRGPNICV